jgi:hypothetical protein
MFIFDQKSTYVFCRETVIIFTIVLIMTTVLLDISYGYQVSVDENNDIQRRLHNK